MATDAAIGFGSHYRMHNGTSLFDIGEVLTVTPPNPQVNRVEATHMQSPGRRREYISGLIDNGEASFEINWVPESASDVLIRTLLASGDTVQHQIEFPDGTTCTYDGIVLGFEKSVPLDDRMTATITVSVTGEEVWA